MPSHKSKTVPRQGGRQWHCGTVEVARRDMGSGTDIGCRGPLQGTGLLNAMATLSRVWA